MTRFVFLFVPGRDWMMATMEGNSLDDIRRAAEAFAQRFGEGKWTELHVYDTPLAVARRGEVVWLS